MYLKGGFAYYLRITIFYARRIVVTFIVRISICAAVNTFQMNLLSIILDVENEGRNSPARRYTG
jgi:hypothetical protein